MGIKEELERIGYVFDAHPAGGTRMRGFGDSVGCNVTGEGGYQVCATLELQGLETALASRHDGALAARADSIRRALKLQ